ncbi:AAA domain-containing protein [Kribbella sp. NBC_00382]|uniref:AAA domain-containing protein n=1 Tax=Kribbella sp. NBC_00382 TaxID=2975967 RepID=UPI002E1D83F7
MTELVAPAGTGMRDLVALAVSQGGLGNDALLAAVLPLFHATAEVHERGLVAPLRGLDQITVDDRTRLGFAPEDAARPLIQSAEIAAREGYRASAVEVVAHRQVELDLGESGGRPQLQVTEPAPEAITAPVLVPGWQSWEHLLGHHDPLTDIFSLGQLLIGLGCGLDLSRTEDVARLINARGNFYSLTGTLHPVIVSVASQMAEPDRHRRAQDLRSLIEQLENYRDQPLDFDVDAITRDTADRREAVLKALRERLFDLSRRNRLVNFRHTAQTINLTEVSVPLMLDVRNIRAEQLFTWNADLAAQLVDGKAKTLGKWIRYDEAPYAASALDKLISTARRDRAEYGQDQLRLVPAFLRWHDLKNDPSTRLTSPLVLVKVDLAKKRGVRDSYTVRITDPVAEINPTLRHHLHQLYGINLPAKVDLSEPDALEVLHEKLRAELQASEPGLQLQLRAKPRIDLVRQRAMVKLRNYRRRQHGNTANEFGGRHYSYSYRRSDYQPLGVQIFRNQLAVQELPLSVVFGEPRRPGAIETDSYVLETGDDGSPYSWDVDLCAVALANFNYRTLGLVRDYDELLESGRSCPSFDQLFSDRPRPLVSDPPELPTSARHLVVPADGSQVAAVARAQRGESFVIQGPPGTGKSQTITNMIADFVARGQRVLFVCQKRAALDVVHARLVSRRLDGLCTLIHDSQADKKAFVHGLRDTYESWLAASDDLEDLTVRRDALVTRVDRLLATVGEFETLLAGGSPTLRTVVNTLAELRSSSWGSSLDPSQRRLIPTPSDWWASREVVGELSSGLAAADPSSSGVLSRSPLSLIAPTVWSAPGADTEIPATATEARTAWTAVAEALAATGLTAPADAGASASDASSVANSWACVDIAVVRRLGELGTVLLPLAERGKSEALDANSRAARELKAAATDHETLLSAEQTAWQEASAWTDPLPLADARSALTVAQSKEGTLLAFLSSDWRRIKSLVHTRTDTTTRAVRPTITELLTTLITAHEATTAVTTNTQNSLQTWGTSNPTTLSQTLHHLTQDKALAPWLDTLATNHPATTATPSPTTAAAAPAPAATAATGGQPGATPSADADTSPASDLPTTPPPGGATALPPGVPSDHTNPAAPGETPPGGPAATPPAMPSDHTTSSPIGEPSSASPSGGAAWVGRAGVVERVARVGELLQRAEAVAGRLLVEGYAERTLGEVQGIVEVLASPGVVPVVQRLVAVMRRFGETPTTVQDAVRGLEATPEQLEYAVCALHWERARAGAPLLGEVTSARLDSIVGELSLVYDELTTVNADVVVGGVRQRFLNELAHSEASATGMSTEERARKKAFSTGRRELEHEFGKVMRYKSIRDLASGAPGEVVARLRPVWLMSPSSVSDTLPLDTAFDVVIYDEASQIPIEEAIPALHRAPQVIVVGDQMQLPPTQYFRVATPAADPDDEVEHVGVALSDDSFLAISALRLASTMLTWHYRSRSEALISFSNAAFYQGRLATIPDRLPAHPAPPWTVRATNDPPTPPTDTTPAPLADGTSLGGAASASRTRSQVVEVVDGMLAGSITAVRVADGIYVRRTNPAEARWIASLVREILARDTGKSLGIVAFSEAQQGEIERALDELAEADSEFGAQYEAEQVRTRDEQDAGLFVKNLENVQGDERDIIIMSVCYAAGPDGRMLMNFGPINTSGGEKRLNVIFSRARQHMVIVSSIEPEAITNTYNDGANTLRRFLTYANAVSQANPEATQAALSQYAVPRTRTADALRSAVAEQLAERLRAEGVVVATEVGESVFRCDLALRHPKDEGHQLAVLIDTPERIAADSLLERLTTHPRALTTGGWRTHHVLTGDWTTNPDAVLARLLDTLNRPTDN